MEQQLWMDEDAIHQFEGNVTLITFADSNERIESNKGLCPLKQHFQQANEDQDGALWKLPAWRN